MTALEVRRPTTPWGNTSQELPDAPHLLDGDVHLWHLPLDAPIYSPATLRSFLASDELDRARQLVFQRDRDHFVAARGCLRVILARYAGLRPHEVQFGYGLHGKPYLLGDESEGGLSFNLSHTRGMALCAVTRNRQVGVDVEQVRPEVDILGIARSTFSPREHAQLAALPPEQRVDAFYACWTRKEAYIKARGEGLSYPLDAFDVSFEPDAPARLLHSTEGQSERGRWIMHEIEAGPGYAAAVVVERPITRIRLLSLLHL